MVLPHCRPITATYTRHSHCYKNCSTSDLIGCNPMLTASAKSSNGMEASMILQGVSEAVTIISRNHGSAREFQPMELNHNSLVQVGKSAVPQLAGHYNKIVYDLIIVLRINGHWGNCTSFWVFSTHSTRTGITLIVSGSSRPALACPFASKF